MTKEEWLVEFQVLNGRMPTEQEVSEAEQRHFQDEMNQVVVEPASKSLFRWDWMKLVKFVLLVMIAIFGYIVGYLFT